MKKTKSFKYWSSEEVEKEFAVKRLRTSNLLNEWLNVDDVEMPAEDMAYIGRLQEDLIMQIEYWNEEELKYHFLGKFVDTINFEQYERYRSFLGRTLTVQTEGMILSGEVDFMVATGKQKPQQPFFFLHEYKQELKRDNDPLGQVLIAMVAARARNPLKRPVYGCYVTGRFWFFVVLAEDEYTVSNAYNATDHDIWAIAKIMKKAKTYVEQDLAAMGL